MVRQAAASGADVDRQLYVVRQRGHEIRMDRFVARELVPLFRLQVIDERPEEKPHDVVIRLTGRYSSHLMGADGRRKPRDVADAEMPPAGRRLGDGLCKVHAFPRSD